MSQEANGDQSLTAAD